MQIIPVLDIRRGLVVHAQGGERHNYQPIQSTLTTATHPEQLLEALLAWYPFPVVYIADLDAIEFSEPQLERYQSICEHFPDIHIWLDLGIKDYQGWLHYRSLSNVSLVVGSETLTDLSWIQDRTIHDSLILSMDRKNGAFLGDEALLSEPDYWPEQLLAMQLDNVGSHTGPAFDWMATLRQMKPDAQIYAAGGVRNIRDLEQLKQEGVAGALMATAIHNGVLRQEDVKALMEQEHCPS